MSHRLGALNIVVIHGIIQENINSAKVSLHNPPMSTKFQLQISKTPKHHQDGRTTPSTSKHDP